MILLTVFALFEIYVKILLCCGDLRCFVARQFLSRIYALLSGKFSSLKSASVKKGTNIRYGSGMSLVFFVTLIVNLVKSPLALGFVSSCLRCPLTNEKKCSIVAILHKITLSSWTTDNNLKQRSLGKVCVNIDNSVSSTVKVKVFPWEGLFLPSMLCRQRESKNKDDILEHLCQVTFATDQQDLIIMICN